MGNAQCGQMFTVLLDLALVGATLLLLLPFAWSSPGECSNPALVALAIAMPSLAAATSLFVCCVAVLMPADENNDMPGGGTRSNSDHTFGAFLVAFLACAWGRGKSPEPGLAGTAPLFFQMFVKITHCFCKITPNI